MTQTILRNAHYIDSRNAILQSSHCSCQKLLAPTECATLRRLAMEQGLQTGNVDNDDLSDNTKKKIGTFDGNNDGRLSVNELIRMVDDFFESHVSHQDIRSMLATITLPLDKLGMVSIHDFLCSDTRAMRRYWTKLIHDIPSKRSRHSEMAWLTSSTSRSTSNSTSSSTIVLVLLAS
jgi:hypothetical protein